MYILRPEARPLGTHYYMLMSDLHIGSPEVDYGRIKAELAKAKEYKAKTRINGDLFDLILPSDHKKYRPDAIHKRLRGRSDIVNASIDWAAELLEGSDIELLGSGNHDDWMLKHHSCDIIQLLCERLKCPQAYAGYTGFVRDKYTDDQRHVSPIDTYYHHGAGGGATLASAVSDFAKTMQFTDCDIIWKGHKHFRIFTHMRRLSCPKSGPAPKYKEVYFVMTGSYMDTYTADTGSSRRASYAEDRALPPQGKGGIMLAVTATRSGVTITTEIDG